jgi:hypothetical protein
MQVADFVLDLIFRPGSSLRLIPVINVSIVLLLGLLIALTYTTIATVHLVVMSTLALGLMASVNWCVDPPLCCHFTDHLLFHS